MVDSPNSQGATRRCIVGGLLGGLSIAAASPQKAVLTSVQRAGVAANKATQPTSRGVAAAAPSTWSLRAVATSYSFASGTSLPFFRLENVTGATMIGNIPRIEATEGQIVTLQIENQLTRDAVQPAVIGLVNGPRIMPGQTGQFSFTMPPAGSYLVGPAGHPQPVGNGRVNLTPQRYVNGIAAMLISRPSNGLNELWNGGPIFDKEYSILFEDEDDRWNSMMANSSARPPRTPYEPNYFMMNGMTYPDTASDPNTYVTGNLGQRILIRMGNLGRMRQAIHFHGYHPEVVARDATPETALGFKDTIPLPHRHTVDVILTPDQTGTYLLHPHSLTAVTENGLYPWGQLTLITIS